MLPLLTVQSLSLYIDIIKIIFFTPIIPSVACSSQSTTGHCWALRTAVMGLGQESLSIIHLTKLPVGSERTPRLLLLDGKWLHVNDVYVQNLNPSQILLVLLLGHQRGFALIKTFRLECHFFLFLLSCIYLFIEES